MPEKYQCHPYTSHQHWPGGHQHLCTFPQAPKIPPNKDLWGQCLHGAVQSQPESIHGSCWVFTEPACEHRASLGQQHRSQTPPGTARAAFPTHRHILGTLGIIHQLLGASTERELVMFCRARAQGRDDLGNSN